MDKETEEIYYTNVACSQLTSKTCPCKDYSNCFSSGEECTKLTRDDIDDYTQLPHTCAYRLLAENQPLPEWHPLLTGSKSAMHKAGESVHNKVVYEIDMIDWEDHILNHPNRGQGKQGFVYRFWGLPSAYPYLNLNWLVSYTFRTNYGGA